jgi:hypothetical protein
MPRKVVDVAVSGSYAYVADGYGGLRIINVSNPSNPTEVGFYDTPGVCLCSVVVSGLLCLCNRLGWPDLRIINVSDPY